ncbi:hypothetical protein [Filomicrobium insigne]|uniref:hypothetical protein n=1 Tax=Filomicrobium insigne TaxID=418854 RepID=UPI000A783807|nr:hypothetical protein [Filomicrobium insigne]
MPGETTTKQDKLKHAGEVNLRFTIAKGKIPKHGGLVLRVGGKVVGEPRWFGLNESQDIPEKLRKRLYGEVEVEGMENVVTNDWDAIVENSKAYEELKALVLVHVTAALQSTYGREMRQHKMRLERQFAKRLEKLPEHRRHFAEAALGKVLAKFYGEHPDRIDTVASVVLDAMERDEYWFVLQQVDVARHGDVVNFAEALRQFGLVDMTLMSERAHGRLQYLSYLDELAANPRTTEAQMHVAMERSLWVLGAPFHLMASNQTLSRIVKEFTDKKFKGRQSAKRPDLLLNTDPGDHYLLIEFKRPSHSISREDEAQAQTYADELSEHLPSKHIKIMMIGGKRVGSAKRQNDAPNLAVWSYADLISRARYEVSWLVENSKHAL